MALESFWNSSKIPLMTKERALCVCVFNFYRQWSKCQQNSSKSLQNFVKEVDGKILKVFQKNLPNVFLNHLISPLGILIRFLSKFLKNSWSREQIVSDTDFESINHSNINLY